MIYLSPNSRPYAMRGKESGARATQSRNGSRSGISASSANSRQLRATKCLLLCEEMPMERLEVSLPISTLSSDRGGHGVRMAAQRKVVEDDGDVVRKLSGQRIDPSKRAAQNGHWKSINSVSTMDARDGPSRCTLVLCLPVRNDRSVPLARSDRRKPCGKQKTSSGHEGRRGLCCYSEPGRCLGRTQDRDRVYGPALGAACQIHAYGPAWHRLALRIRAKPP